MLVNTPMESLAKMTSLPLQIDLGKLDEGTLNCLHANAADVDHMSCNKFKNNQTVTINLLGLWNGIRRSTMNSSKGTTNKPFSLFLKKT